MTEVITPRPPGFRGPVMIVDDDANFRTWLTEVFSEIEVRADAFESAAHAVKFSERQAWSWKPQLVITDLVMTGLGGYQFIRKSHELFSQRNTVPVIVISQLTQPEDKAEAIVAGAAEYLTKPVTKEEVIETVYRALSPKKELTPEDDML